MLEAVEYPVENMLFSVDRGGERKSRTKTHKRTHRHTEKHCQETTSFCFFKDVLKYWETKRKLGKCSCARQLHFISLLV